VIEHPLLEEFMPCVQDGHQSDRARAQASGDALRRYADGRELGAARRLCLRLRPHRGLHQAGSGDYAKGSVTWSAS